MRVLLCVDGSHHSEKMLQVAAKMPWLRGADFSVLTCTHELSVDHFDLTTDPQDVAEINQSMEHSSQELLQKYTDFLAGFDINSQSILLKGDPKRQITDFAAHNSFDLIVLGSRGLNPVKGILLGSTSYAVISNSPCSVLLYRPIEDPQFWQLLEQPSKMNILIAYCTKSHAQSACHFINHIPDQSVDQLHIVTFMQRKHHYGMQTPFFQTEEWSHLKQGIHTSQEKTKEYFQRYHKDWDIHTEIVENCDDYVDELHRYRKHHQVMMQVIGAKHKDHPARTMGSLTLRLVHSHDIPLLIAQ